MVEKIKKISKRLAIGSEDKTLLPRGEKGVKMLNNKDDYAIKRGEIYYILQGNEEEIGSEQRSGRPGIIISNDINNLHSEVVEVVLLTTREKTPLPTHISINSSQYPSVALCEQIKTFSKQRLGDYVGTITNKEMIELEKALTISIGISGVVDNMSLLEKELEEAETTIEQLKKELMQEKVRTAPIMVESNSDIVKAERDIYKKMYEQLLERVISKKEDE